MQETCYFRGELLDRNVPKEEQLVSKGLTPQRIEQIEMEGYIDPCCESFSDLISARPVIDYGVPSVRGYETAVAKLDESGHTTYGWVVFDYCPFCGKPLAKEIHIGHRQTKMEDFSEQ